MKSRLIALAFLACAIQIASAAAPAGERHVILISLDGLAHFYFDDPKAQLPTLRELAAKGARAKKMLCSFPTVTWPNHTTLVTGVTPAKHGIIGNGIFDRAGQKNVTYLCDPLFDMADCVKAPTVFDLAHRSGMKTAGVCWPATRNAKTLDWTVPDMMEQDLFEKYSTPSLLAGCRQAGIPFEKQQEWCKAGNAGKSPRDFMYAQIARHIILKHKPQLLVLHLMSADGFQHGSGRQSPEAYFAVNDCDRHVRDVVDAVKDAGLIESTTFIITADHGFRSFTRQIQPNVMFRKAGLIAAAVGGRVTSRRAWCHGEGGSAFIYVLDDANRAQIVADIKPKLAALEGVDWVREPAEYARLGFPTPDEDARSPDLLMSAKDGFSFSEVAAGEDEISRTDSLRGTHGYDPNVEDMRAIFIAAGAGIRKGAVLDEMTNLDVAPTMAKLLGLEMKNVDGRVLGEILVK
jgi:predicted AlkP superfamily pyrophosphatase or phosphodiesterase